MPILLNGMERRASGREGIRIALINNMPDPVLEDTEAQFIDLLNAASGDIPVRVELFSLPNAFRCERTKSRLSQFYRELDSLWDSRFDALIVTGTEPRQADLRQEAYWQSLIDVMKWAQENTASTVLSCLAAHAGVLYSDGIQREPLERKQCGVFSFRRTGRHALTCGLADTLDVPHSRWNEVPPQALESCGYTILTESAVNGVDLFVKQQQSSLFVYLQGHPEYREDTLLEEYRRDIRRFLKGAKDTYPLMPLGCFDKAAADALSEFSRLAVAGRSEEVVPEFPEIAVRRNLHNRWRTSAITTYSNWLQFVASALVAV